MKFTANDYYMYHNLTLQTWIAICVLCFCFIMPNAAMAWLPNGLLDATGILRETKSKAEFRASRLKGLQSTLSKRTYQDLERLYEDAKAAFDGWIRQLQIDVETGGEIDISERYKKTLEEASLKADTFFENVDSLLEDPELGKGEWVTDLLETLTDVTIKIFKEFRSIDREKREALTKALGEFRWRELRDLPPR